MNSISKKMATLLLLLCSCLVLTAQDCFTPTLSSINLGDSACGSEEVEFCFTFDQDVEGAEFFYVAQYYDGDQTAGQSNPPANIVCEGCGTGPWCFSFNLSTNQGQCDGSTRRLELSGRFTCPDGSPLLSFGQYAGELIAEAEIYPAPFLFRAFPQFLGCGNEPTLNTPYCNEGLTFGWSETGPPQEGCTALEVPPVTGIYEWFIPLPANLANAPCAYDNSGIVQVPGCEVCPECPTVNTFNDTQTICVIDEPDLFDYTPAAVIASDPDGTAEFLVWTTDGMTPMEDGSNIYVGTDETPEPTCDEVTFTLTAWLQCDLLQNGIFPPYQIDDSFIFAGTLTINKETQLVPVLCDDLDPCTFNDLLYIDQCTGFECFPCLGIPENIETRIVCDDTPVCNPNTGVITIQVPNDFCGCETVTLPPPTCDDNPVCLGDGQTSIEVYDFSSCTCVPQIQPPVECSGEITCDANGQRYIDTLDPETCQCGPVPYTFAVCASNPVCNPDGSISTLLFDTEICDCAWTTSAPVICDDTPVCDGAGQTTIQVRDPETCECTDTAGPPITCDDSIICSPSGERFTEVYDEETCECVTTQLGTLFCVTTPTCNPDGSTSTYSYDFETCSCVEEIIPPVECDDTPVCDGAGVRTIQVFDQANCTCVPEILEPISCDPNPVCDGQGNTTVQAFDESNCQCVTTTLEPVFCNPDPVCDGQGNTTVQAYDSGTCQCVTTTLEPVFCNPDPVCDGQGNTTVQAYDSGTCQCVTTTLEPVFCNPDPVCDGQGNTTVQAYDSGTCQCVTTTLEPVFCNPDPVCDGQGNTTVQAYDNETCQCVTTTLEPVFCDDTIVCNLLDQPTIQVYEDETCTCVTEIVPDLSAPVIDCNSLITITPESAPGECSTTAIIIQLPTAQDECDGLVAGVGTRSDGASLNSPWPVGTTTIEWTFTDSAGNAVACSQAVIVSDNEAPQFSECPADIYSCDGYASWEIPEFTDNCAAMISSITPPSGSIFAPGQNPVSISIVDNYGNPAECQFMVIYEPFSVNIFASGNTLTGLSCDGAADGWLEAEVVSDFNDDYTYEWSTGDNTPSIVNLQAGTYIVTVSNSAGCEVISSYQVLSPSSLEVSNEIVEGTPCPEEVDTEDAGGSASLFVQGGTPPYSYVWTSTEPGFIDPGTASITGLAAGTYNYVVIDNNDCSITGSIQITNPPSFDIGSYGVNQAEGNSGNTLPFYYNTHQIEITGGTGPYLYDWDRSGYVRFTHDITEEGETFSFIYADNAEWSLTVTDSNGCTSEALVFSNDSGAGGGNPSVGNNGNVLDIDNVTIQGETSAGDDGCIHLEVVGGTPTYYYEWSGPGFSAGPDTNLASLCNLESGLYEVTVTDSGNPEQYTIGYYWLPKDRRSGRLKFAGSSLDKGLYLAVRPNVVHQQCLLELWSLEQGAISLEIVDINGKVFPVGTLQSESNVLVNQTIDLGQFNLGPGLYFLHASHELGQHQTVTFVVAE